MLIVVKYGTIDVSSVAREMLVADALKVFFLILSALFPIVDPVSGSPVFLALTSAYSPETRRALSQHVAVYSFFLMIGSYFIGSHVLGFFGVSLPVVQVGGGLAVVAVGWALLMQKDEAHDPCVEIFSRKTYFERRSTH